MASYKKILLRNTGNYALVDPEDYDLIIGFGQWYENDQGYAIKRVSIGKKKKTIRMHSVINKTPKGLMTDHINRSKLDNRKQNLRSVSAAINCWNREEVNYHTKYDLPAGISYDKNRDKYWATQTIRKRFNTLEEAVEFTKQSKKEVL